MIRLLRSSRVLSWGMTAVVVTAVGVCPAQDRKGSAGAAPRKGSSPAERASGVITKVEKMPPGSASDSRAGGQAGRTRQDRRLLRLTINTAVVWRDWARDQATESVSQPARREAAEGANSVATKGQPASKDTLVLIDLGPETQVETRFRAPTDESSKGAKSPEGASQDDRASAPPRGATTQAAKPTRFTVNDLRPGLFVEVDFRHRNDVPQDRAATVAVIRPVGGPQSPPRPAEK